MDTTTPTMNDGTLAAGYPAASVPMTDPEKPDRGPLPDPNVPAKARRRKFNAETRLRIVREAEGCKEHGGVGALLRREGIYYSQLAKWRKECDRSGVEGLKNRKPGPKPAVSPEQAARIHELEKQLRRVSKRLRQAEAIIEIQKKVAAMMQEIRRKRASPETES
ncbi:MAG: helix-turn-helix domain-containing protein [Planctomycetes bacterium]|nr:helix-turn-helix domain-containing protein [Planctomycetota bacterium]